MPFAHPGSASPSTLINLTAPVFSCESASEATPANPNFAISVDHLLRLILAPLLWLGGPWLPFLLNFFTAAQISLAMESTADSGSAMPLLFYYLYPGAVFFYFIAASLFSVLNLHHLRPGTHPKTQSRDRRAAAGLLGVFALTYVVQLVVSFSIASSDIRGPPAEHNVVGNLSCLLVVGIQLLGLSESSEIVWYPYQGTWVIALAFEAALSGCLIFESVSQALATYETTELILALLRCTILLALSMLSLLQRLIHRLKWKPDLEREPLLIDRANVTRGGYGSTPRNGDTADEELEYGWQRCEREGRNTMEARLKEDGNWFAYSKSFMVSRPN